MAARRVELGFEGGSVLRLTIDDRSAADLIGRLAGSEGWETFSAEEGEYQVNRAKLLFTRLEPGEVTGRVGFGGGA